MGKPLLKTMTMTCILSLACLSQVMAQQVLVKILRPVLDPATEKIIVPYQLSETQNHRLTYDLDLYYSTNQGKSYIGPLRQVSGDVGTGITPGATKQIVWDFLLEAPELTNQGNSLQLKFKIVTRTNEAAKTAYKKKLGGPFNALLSVVLPGAGDPAVRTGKGYGAITFFTWGALGTGLLFRLSARRNYEKYQESSNIAELDHLFFLAKSHKKASNILLASGIVIWALDVVLVAVKGFQNLKKRRAISLFDKKIYPRLGFNYDSQLQQPHLSLRLKF